MARAGAVGLKSGPPAQLKGRDAGPRAAVTMIDGFVARAKRKACAASPSASETWSSRQRPVDRQFLARRHLSQGAWESSRGQGSPGTPGQMRAPFTLIDVASVVVVPPPTEITALAGTNPSMAQVSP